MKSNLAPNELIEQLIKENLNTQAPYLDLAFCGLQGDEPALEMLAECTHLKGLNMSDTPEEYDEEKSMWSTPYEMHSRELEYDHNFFEIDAIPAYLPTSLEYLCIGNTQDGQSYIEDIGNVAKLTNLKRLNLNYNSINDLSPLQWLPQLERLHLYHNQLEDLTPLAYLRQLWQLDIGYNDEVNDIAPLSKLTKLRHLEASVCSIYDLAPLKGLTRLEILQLKNNYQHLGDLEVFGHLTNLRKLFIGGNEMTQLSPLKDLHQLEILELEEVSFIELEEDQMAREDNEEEDFVYTFDLPALPALKTLKANKCKLDQLLLPHLPQLQELDISENALTDTYRVANLPRLKVLNTMANQIKHLVLEDLPALENLAIGNSLLAELSWAPMPHLQILGIYGMAQLTSLDLRVAPHLKTLNIKGLTQLTSLDLSVVPQLELLNGTELHIKTIDLSQQKALKKLWLTESQLGELVLANNYSVLEEIRFSENQAAHFEVPPQCPKLHTIDLAQNKLTYLKVEHLPALAGIYVRENTLATLVLHNLPELTNLGLANNQLKAFAPEWLQVCPKLNWVDLVGNPIENLPQEVYINSYECVDDIRQLLNQEKQ